VPVEQIARELSTTAMASSVRIIAADGTEDEVTMALRAARGSIEEVEATCSRFDASSELSRVNARPSGPHEVSALLLEMVGLAVTGHQGTTGRFDPRVLGDLERMGYDRTFLEMNREGGHLAQRPPRGDWAPVVDPHRALLDLRGAPIDLGGVAKGAAADRALRAMAVHGVHGLVDIGGDGAVSGPDGLGAPWSIGIEDPDGQEEPVAVFALSRGGYATSSIRLRHWEIAGTAVHHLLDPVTGQPGGEGLRSVTVLAASGAMAEIAAKAAFLAGRSGIAQHADDESLACFWIDVEGRRSWSAAMTPSLIWVRP